MKQNEVGPTDVIVKLMDEKEIKLTKIYSGIKQSLRNIENCDWVLFNYLTGQLISEDNIKYSHKLIAITQAEIKMLFQIYQKYNQSQEDSKKLKEVLSNYELLQKKYQDFVASTPTQMISQHQSAEKASELAAELQTLKDQVNEQKIELEREKQISKEIISSNEELIQIAQNQEAQQIQLVEENKLLKENSARLIEQISNRDMLEQEIKNKESQSELLTKQIEQKKTLSKKLELEIQEKKRYSQQLTEDINSRSNQYSIVLPENIHDKQSIRVIKTKPNNKSKQTEQQISELHEPSQQSDSSQEAVNPISEINNQETLYKNQFQNQSEINLGI